MHKSERKSRALELDAELARAVSTGDKIAWDRFVTMYGGLVRSVVSDYLGCLIAKPSAADVHAITKSLFKDVAADKFAMLTRFESGSTLDTFLAIAAAHRVQEYIRIEQEKGRYTSLSTDQNNVLWCSNEKETTIKDKGLAAPVEEALASIEPDEAIVFRLFYFHEVEYEDIGAVLHMNIASVTRTLKNARDKVSKKLADAGRSIDEILY